MLMRVGLMVIACTSSAIIVINVESKRARGHGVSGWRSVNRMIFAMRRLDRLGLATSKGPIRG